MPVADPGAQTTITETVAGIFCGRIDDFNDRSYQPPAPPSPTPVAYNATTNATSSNSTTSGAAENTAASDNSLSGGAIAGIVIGVLAGLALVAALIFFLLRRRKTKRKPLDNTPEVPVAPVAEVHGHDSRFELGSDGKNELPTSAKEGGRDYRRKLSELEGKSLQREPAELPAS